MQQYRLDESTEKRFWQYVRKTKDCWVWAGHRDRRGYGRLTVRYKSGKETSAQAHRLSFFMHGGKTTAVRPYIIHSCDNPACVNPKHLRAGSHADNMQDRDEHHRTAKGMRHGAHLHPEHWVRGEHHGNAKLTAANVAEIRQMYKDGFLQREIACRFGVNRCTVGRIVTGKTWAPDPGKSMSLTDWAKKTASKEKVHESTGA